MHIISARAEAVSGRAETTGGQMVALTTARQARLSARVLTKRAVGPMMASLPARCAGTPRRWMPMARRLGIVRGSLGATISFTVFVIVRDAREDRVFYTGP